MKLTLNATNVYCIMLMAILAFGGCSNDDEAMPQHKGATTQLMQNIADHVPYIQEVLNEKIHKISDGVNITEVSFTYCTKQTHMFIADVNGQLKTNCNRTNRKSRSRWGQCIIGNKWPFKGDLL